MPPTGLKIYFNDGKNASKTSTKSQKKAIKLKKKFEINPNNVLSINRNNIKISLKKI